MGAGIMRKCVLHIGTEKTGSSSIQSALSAGADVLSGAGLIYPGRETAHFELALCAVEKAIWPPWFDDERAALYLESLKAEISNAPSGATVLFSTEHFHSRLYAPHHFDRLQGILADLNLTVSKVIVYFRPQAELAKSALQTAVRWGHAQRVVVDEMTGRHGYYYDHLSVCELWRDRFGAEAMDIVSYSKRREEHDLLRDMESRIGVPLGSLSRENEEIQQNAALSEGVVFSLMHLNRLGQLDHRERFVSLIESWPWARRGAWSYWTARELAEIDAFFSPRNRRMCDEFHLDPRDFSAIGTEKERSDSLAGPQAEPRSDLEILTGLWSEYVKLSSETDAERSRADAAEGVALDLQNQLLSALEQAKSLQGAIESLMSTLEGVTRERDSALHGMAELRAVVERLTQAESNTGTHATEV
jgi:superoxide dismutase